MRLIIIGAGGHGQAVREVAGALRKYLTADGSENIIFLDDRYRESKFENGIIKYNYKKRLL